MSIPELFIRRPVMTTLVMAGILLFGVIAYRRLPVSELPSVDFPTLQVTASLPGASPDTMASSVATPLERQFSAIAGLDSMTSTSSLGVTQITLQFSLSRNLDGAAVDVVTAITQAQPLLPPEMPSLPSFQKVNPADQPILYLSVHSTLLPLSTVDEYAETSMAQRISMVNGVAQVQVFGSQKYAVRVQVNPDALTALGIGIDSVQNAITAANVNTAHRHAVRPKPGVYDSGVRPAHVRGRLPPAPGRLSQRLTRVPAPARPRDRQRPERQDRKLVQRHPCHRAGHPAAAGNQHGPGRQRDPAPLADLPRRIPESVDLTVLYDRSQSIRDSINDLQFTLFISMILVILVIFFFLRNVSATVIPSAWRCRCQWSAPFRSCTCWATVSTPSP